MTILSPDQIPLDDGNLVNLLNALPSVALVLDDGLNVEFANESFCDNVEEMQDEIVGKNFLALLPKQVQTPIKNCIEQLSPGNPEVSETLYCPVCGTLPSGHEWTFQLETEQDGYGDRYFVFGPEGTDRRRNEEDGRESQEADLTEKIFRAMADSIEEAFWLMDADWSQVLYANRACERMYGVEYEELIEDVNNWTRHVVDEDRDVMYANLAPEDVTGLTESRTVSFRLDHPERGRRHIKLRLSPIPVAGETQRLVGLATDVTDRERKIKRSEQKFKAVFNSTVSALGLLEPDGTILEANEAAREMVDVRMEEERGKPFWASAWWDHSEELQERFKQAVQTASEGEVDQFEVSYPLSGGREAALEFTVSPVKNDEGEVIYIIPEGRDVTMQKKLQNELEAQRDFLQTIINSAPNFIFVKDWEGRFRLVNESLADFFGVEKDEIIGEKEQKFLTSEGEVEKVYEDDREVLRNGEIKHIPQERVEDPKTGEEIIFATVKVPLDLGNDPENRRVLGIATDITERVRIKQQQERLVRILQHTPDYVGTVTPNGDIEYLNASLRDLIGLGDDADLDELSMFDFFPDDMAETLRDEILVAAKENGIWSGEARLKTSENKETPVSQVIVTHYDENGDVEYFSTIMRDISELKDIQTSLERSLEEKEILLREVHHRVKNNMQIISSLLRMQDRDIDDEQTKKMIEESQQRIHSMALMHENFYNSEDITSVNFGSYLEELIEGLLSSQSNQETTIDVDYDVDDSADFGMDEAIACGLIINELVANAIEHAFNGRDQGRIRVGFCVRDDETAEIVVEDDGIGVDEEDFESEKALGWDLITSLAEYQLEGEITVTESEKLGGARFELEFPFHAFEGVEV